MGAQAAERGSIPERIRVCSEFVAAVHRQSKAMLDVIVTMDETMVSYHTSEMKKQSKQWIPWGQPGPLKARVHVSLTKQMVMAFFDSHGMTYTHVIPRGASINAAYTIKVLVTFLEPGAGILLLALSRYIGDPDVIDHQQGFVPNNYH
jgi:hypothetical protein